MHIAIDARIINSSTGRYVERLIHYLQEVDPVNQYSILVRKKDLTYWKPKSVNFTVIEAEYDQYSVAEQTGYLRFLNNLKPDLVHFCMPQQPVLYKGRSVTTMHDLTLLKTYNSDKNWFVFRFKQLVGKFVFKRIARTNEYIIAISEFTKKEYQTLTRIANTKIPVIYEAADVSVDSLRPYNHPFDRYIMYVGQQSDYKNIKRLGDAHQKLLEHHPDLGLILVGKKNMATRTNEKYFTDKKYKNILFTDFIDDEQRDWLYTNTAAYVFPSLMEGFGLPGLEAMGYGAPVVSSNQTCLPEIYGEAAHYFDPFDTDDIARAISDVLSDDTLRTSLITKGSEQYKKYSWQRMATQTHEIYLKALERSN